MRQGITQTNRDGNILLRQAEWDTYMNICVYASMNRAILAQMMTFCPCSAMQSSEQILSRRNFFQFQSKYKISVKDNALKMHSTKCRPLSLGFSLKHCRRKLGRRLSVATHLTLNYTELWVCISDRVSCILISALQPTYHYRPKYSLIWWHMYAP